MNARPLLAIALLCASIAAQAAGSCFNVAGDIVRQSGNRLDRQELTEVLQALGRSGRLPPKFVTKKQARAAGWRPGDSLWSVPALQGKSIGGDRFGNYEKQLPKGQWQEADLGYKGGKRGAYRIVFSRDGQRYVTVDHYQRFVEVPPCR
ncbi:ribonuclease [Xenophilus sp. AP218F]|nr:ribonuclease domain-containing protein [Chromobacterium sp. ASV5]OWY38526.1 ribonuclease [Xenophilus sp. AP218F]